MELNLFNQGLKADSARITKYIDVDSIHCRTLKVGHSLTIIDAGPVAPPATIVRPFLQQLLNSSDNSIVLEGGSASSPAPARDNIKLTIGVLNSSVGPQHRLNLHSNFNNDVFASFTNINLYPSGPLFSATDGFKVGILANGIAQINQQENLDLQFHTNNTQRAVILANGRTGIGANNPLNRLEVTSAAPDFGGGNVTTPGGSSGIRTTNMTSATPTLASNGKVVSVNANGDFILVPDVSTGTVGATAKNGLNTSVGAPDVELGGNLIRPTDVNQNNFNLTWNGVGQFGIGTGLSGPAGFFSGARLELNDNNNNNSMYIRNVTPGGGAAGITMDILSTGLTNYGQIVNVSGAQNQQGIYLNATGIVGTSVNQGLIIKASEGHIVEGGRLNGQTSDPATFQAFGSLSQLFLQDPHYFSRRAASGSMIVGTANGTKYGAVATSHNSNNDMNVGFGGIIGVNGINTNNVCNGTSVKNIAVYGGFSNSTPQWSNTTVGNFAGYFEGDVNITGNLTVIGSYPSDALLKTNIDTIGNALGILKRLTPKHFYYDTTRYFLAGHSKKQYGLLAQDVQNVLPELVGGYGVADKKDTLGNVISAGGIFKNLNYNSLIALLIKGLQEQQKRIDSLINPSANQNRLQNPNTNSNSTKITQELNKLNVTLSNVDAIVLDQNQPNPFSENTIIKYNIPEKYGFAQLIFTTADGRIIKTIDINKNGPGEITVYASDLSSGIYNYTLVIDGKTIETKKNGEAISIHVCNRIIL